jgi:hypothetical protein
MAKFLSQDWLDLQRELLGASGTGAPGEINGTVQFVISGTPDGEKKYFFRIDGGHLVDSSIGAADNADVTVTSTWDDAVAVSKGDLDPSVGFMQGKIKVAGDMKKVLALLPLTSGTANSETVAQLRAATEY